MFNHKTNKRNQPIRTEIKNKADCAERGKHVQVKPCWVGFAHIPVILQNITWVSDLPNGSGEGEGKEKPEPQVSQNIKRVFLTNYGVGKFSLDQTQVNDFQHSIFVSNMLFFIWGQLLLTCVMFLASWNTFLARNIWENQGSDPQEWNTYNRVL